MTICEKMKTVDNNCLHYDGMYGHCVKCKEGYVEFEEKCESCDIFGPCLNCTVDGCYECASSMKLVNGYCYDPSEIEEGGLKTSLKQVLKEETEDYSEWKEPVDGKCEQGYYLTESNKCVTCQVEGCILCGDS